MAMTSNSATPTAQAPPPNAQAASPGGGGGDSGPGKVQLAAQKLNNMEGTGSRRGSSEWSASRSHVVKGSDRWGHWASLDQERTLNGAFRFDINECK